MKTLTVIIPVSKRESFETIQKSINAFKRVDFTCFDHRIVYAIDVPDDIRRYYQKLQLPENMELLWVVYTGLKQSSAYNAALRKYPDSDYYAFFDVDAIPSTDFFHKCVRVDADFVSCDRHVSNVRQNSITKTISEEYDFCNIGRRLMNKHIRKFFPASCTGLIRGKVLHDFMFTEKTSADSELYRHILLNDFTMGYAHDTHYMENAPTTLKMLYNQRIRWLSDTWRTCVKTVGSSNSWKENISNFSMHLIGMFSIVGLIALIPFSKHFWGYNSVFHSVFMQYISLASMIKTIKRDEVAWV